MAKRYFVVVDEKNEDTDHVFTGTCPRQAALKAASKGMTKIRLRERGRKTKRRRLITIHVFTGERKKVPRPENAPSWLEKYETIWKPNVKKVKTDHI